MLKNRIFRSLAVLPPAVQHFLANPRLCDNLRRLQDLCRIHPRVFALWATRLEVLEQAGRHAEAVRLWSLMLQRYRGMPVVSRSLPKRPLNRGDIVRVPAYLHSLQTLFGHKDSVSSAHS